MTTDTVKLPDAKYQGYIWYSNDTEPRIIEGTFDLELRADVNPFIAEAFLLDVDNSISHSIRYVDGHYLFNSTQLNSDDYCNAIPFAGKNMKGRNLLFRQRWRTIKDKYCCEMETQVPEQMVFVGFSKD